MKPLRSMIVILCGLALLLCSCQKPAPPSSAAPTGQPADTAVPTAAPPVSTPAPTEIPSPAPAPAETPAPTAPPLSFTRSNFPRLDGSSATVPLGTAIAAQLLGETPEQVADLVRFSRTTQSFRSLMAGYCDLLLSAEPAASIWEEKEAAGFDWEMEPFAVDGLVFLVNKDNPVDSLTVEEIRGIYSGAITNWSQVGGENRDIVAFQRNAEAGSQTAMLQLVMQDTPMMTPPSTWIAGSMGGLMEAVASFDGSSAAIGYSVYYYANDMKMADGLKILQVEGVAPSAETLRREEYPLLLQYYVLIQAGLEDSAPAKQLFRWILSEPGQQLAAGLGYVSMLDVEPDPAGAPLPRPDAVWTLSEHYVGGDPLEPGVQYGPLIPFEGARTQTADGPNVEYGLFTGDGEIVSAPGNYTVQYEGDWMILRRPSRDPALGSRYLETTLVSRRDGSLHEMGLCTFGASWHPDIPFWAGYPDGTLVLLDADLTPVQTVAGSALEAVLGDRAFDALTWGTAELDVIFGTEWIQLYCVLDDVYELYVRLADGAVFASLPEGSAFEYVTVPREEPHFPGYEVQYTIQDPVTGERYHRAAREDGTMCLLDEAGQVLRQGEINGIWEIMNGLYHMDGEDSCAWYDLRTDECVFRYYVHDCDA